MRMRDKWLGEGGEERKRNWNQNHVHHTQVRSKWGEIEKRWKWCCLCSIESEWNQWCVKGIGKKNQVKSEKSLLIDSNNYHQFNLIFFPTNHFSEVKKK